MPRVIVPLFLLLVLLPAPSSAFRLASGSVAVFAAPALAGKLLAAPDDFFLRMTRYDLALRLKDPAATPERYREFAASQALAWTPAEERRVRRLLRPALPVLRQLRLPFPSTVFLVKTSGREEGDAAYTRGNAVILPAGYLRLADRTLRRILYHELFHIVSRSSPSLRMRLYAAIGFQPCRGMELPPELERRRLTNPDSPAEQYAITVSAAGRTFEAVPLTLCDCDIGDFASGAGFFDFWTVRLMEVEREGESCRVRREADEVLLHRVPDVAGFYEQVGRNTGYVVHPEEVLADNFILLLTGEAAPSPEMPRKMRAIFREEAGKLRD